MKVSYIFVQDERSSELLNSIKIYHNEIGGDTRFDRVVQIMENNKNIAEIELFKNNAKLFVVFLVFCFQALFSARAKSLVTCCHLCYKNGLAVCEPVAVRLFFIF